MTDPEQDLETLFEAARNERPQMPPALNARILADAAAAQPVSRPRRAAPRWQQWLEVIGGWPALGGMAVAGAAGVWIGFSPPQMLPDPISLVQMSDSSLFASDDLILALAEEN